MSKTVPNFLFPTNFRNGKNIKRLIKDFNVQGYGIAVYLLETLAETEGHQYPINDIDLIADPVLGLIITDICLSLIVSDLIILTFFIKKIGNEFSFPNGPNL